jgi:hypothetical protein
MPPMKQRLSAFMTSHHTGERRRVIDAVMVEAPRAPRRDLPMIVESVEPTVVPPQMQQLADMIAGVILERLGPAPAQSESAQSEPEPPLVVDVVIHDLRQLADTFLEGRIAEIADRSRKSTYRSAFRYWWLSFKGKADPTPFPDEAAIEAFGKCCRATGSDEYALARQRVMREWREWLTERGIARNTPSTAPASTSTALVVADQGERAATEAGRNLTTSDVDALIGALEDKLFGGEASEDYWATVVRRVAAAIGARGIATFCKVDLETAERWITLHKYPKHAREELEYSFMFLLMRRAKAKRGKDLDDLWDELHERESFWVGSGPGYDEV